MIGAKPLPSVLVVGPVPPPEFGVAKATKLMLESLVLNKRLRLLHLDTSDDRGVANIGRLDLRNVRLGLKHVATLVHMLAKERPHMVLLTASQGKFGLLRDALFVWIARLFGSKVVTYLRGSRYAETRVNEGRMAARLPAVGTRDERRGRDRDARRRGVVPEPCGRRHCVAVARR